MKILVKKLIADAKIPSFALPGDVGMDLFSAEDVVLKPGGRASVKTGIAIKIPEGYAGLIWDKGGIAWKGGIKTMGGVVDSGYRGEVGVVLCNLSKEVYTIKKGDKVAQMLVQKVESPEIVETDKLDETTRGAGAFGSTGLQ
jgi:dUTP pyrophosphatase